MVISQIWQVSDLLQAFDPTFFLSSRKEEKETYPFPANDLHEHRVCWAETDSPSDGSLWGTPSVAAGIVASTTLASLRLHDAEVYFL